MREVRNGIVFRWEDDMGFESNLNRVTSVVRNGFLVGKKPTFRGLKNEIRKGRWQASVLNYHRPDEGPYNIRVVRTKKGWQIKAIPV